jgi:hypothetical protein
MPYRRPASPAAVVALCAIGALLAGAAGTAAYLGLSHYLRHQPVADPVPTSTAGTTAPPAGDPCPTYTITAVKDSGGPGRLTIVLYVEGTHAGLATAEAWICRDTDGTLYYQGHDETGPPTAATSANTILLGGTVKGTVEPDGPTTYVATNGPTSYRVSPTEFAVITAAGRTDFTITTVRPQR